MVYFIKTQVNNLFHKPVFSVNHLGDVNEASAGVWTSMAFSSPAQTTVEETFSVKTSKTATTASENGADHPGRPHPLLPFVLTTWPRARVFSLIHTFYALPAVHSKIEEKTGKQKIKSRHSQQKRQLQIFTFIFCCWPSMGGGVGSQMIHSIRPFSGMPSLKPVHRSITIYALNGYFFRRLRVSLRFVKWNIKNFEKQKKKSGPLIENRSGLGYGIWHPSHFPKEQKRNIR